MVNKERFLHAVSTFIENDMVRDAKGNHKIILGIAKAAIRRNPDGVFNALKDNGFVSLLGVIDDHDNVDVDMLVDILSEGFGSDEFSIKFHLLGTEYNIHLSASDMQTIKRYM